MTLSDYVKIVRKRWLLVAIVVTAACLGAGYYGSIVSKPVYEASSKIIVGKATMENGLLQMSPGDAAVSAMLVNTYKQLIRTPGILQQVAATHPELHVSADALLQSLQVGSVAGSQIMDVSWKDPSYARASEIVNAVTSVFQAKVPDILRTDSTMIVIPSDPQLPPASEQTGLTFLLLVAFTVSSFAAVFLAFLLEYFDTRLREAEQVEQLLDVPVLAGIPEIRKTDAMNAKPAAAKRYARTQEERHVHLNG